MFNADFNALEDRGSAIKTGDPNKIVIFEKGLDSHAFKASFYFADLLPEIDRYSADDLNMIKNKYGEIRDDSKPVTFGKTYGGGDQFLVKKGYSAERIKLINEGWNQMFSHSIIHERKMRKEAEEKGYFELLFGLKLRTPILASKRASESAKAKEFRSAFNAHTQCFGMLTSRAAEEFLMRIRSASPEIQEGVYVSNIIHDDIIGYCKETPEVIDWVNKNLIECMEWQDDDYIRHDIVKMTSEVGIGFNWKDRVDLKNNASIEDIKAALIEAREMIGV